MAPQELVPGVVTAAALLCVVACTEKSDFEEAPRARAPEEPLVTKKKRAAANRKRGQVPAGHPPVGGENRAAPGGESAPAGGGAASLPVDWKTPSSWNEQPPSSRMRKAQYEIPGPNGNKPAKLAVFHFPSVRGMVERNIGRWKKQFASSVDAQRSERTVSGWTVHTVDISGTFDASRGVGAGGPKENYRLLGAIVETADGLVVFKMVGPRETVGANESGFETVISSLKPSG